jgi:hypothetical protein
VRAHNCRQHVQVEQREKINRAEVAIDRRRTADFRADRQICA